MYKAPLTATVFKDFSSCYSNFAPPEHSSKSEAFVYVDSDGVKLLTGVVGDQNNSKDGLFALSLAEDGWVEMLAFYEAS